MKASLNILDAYGLLPGQTFRIPSKSEPGIMYKVQEYQHGWRCDCVAGLMKQPCRHIRIAQNALHGETYRPTIDQSFGEDVSRQET
jgi:hypothetical protein